MQNNARVVTSYHPVVSRMSLHTHISILLVGDLKEKVCHLPTPTQAHVLC